MADLSGESLDAKIATLFVAMTGIFSQTWRRKYGVDDDKSGTWGRVIADLSMRQIHGGIELIRMEWQGDWPPTPAQFRRHALDSVRPYDITPSDRRLKAQPADEHVAKDHLARMRRMLGSAA